jgi:hypothetical protein
MVKVTSFSLSETEVIFSNADSAFVVYEIGLKEAEVIFSCSGVVVA